MVCDPAEMDTSSNSTTSSSNTTGLHANNNHTNNNKVINMQHNRWRVDQLFEGCRLKVDNVSGRTYSKCLTILLLKKTFSRS